MVVYVKLYALIVFRCSFADVGYFTDIFQILFLKRGRESDLSAAVSQKRLPRIPSKILNCVITLQRNIKYTFFTFIGCFFG